MKHSFTFTALAMTAALNACSDQQGQSVVVFENPTRYSESSTVTIKDKRRIPPEAKSIAVGLSEDSIRCDASVCTVTIHDVEWEVTREAALATSKPAQAPGTLCEGEVGKDGFGIGESGGGFALSENAKRTLLEGAPESARAHANETLVVTVGHVLDIIPCNRLYFAFQWVEPLITPAPRAYQPTSQVPPLRVSTATIPVSRVARCAAVLKTQHQSDGVHPDYAIMAVHWLSEHPETPPGLDIVDDDASLDCEGEAIASMGHPLGVPLTVSTNGTLVREASNGAVRLARLTAMQGSAGSPVFPASCIEASARTTACPVIGQVTDVGFGPTISVLDPSYRYRFRLSYAITASKNGRRCWQYLNPDDKQHRAFFLRLGAPPLESDDLLTAITTVLPSAPGSIFFPGAGWQ